MKEWHKSSYSGNQGACVEVAEGDNVLVRDTENRNLGHIELTPDAWTALVKAL
ncbi:DUF397 domain-containing protein [Nocardiopsis dassonvillei]